MARKPGPHLLKPGATVWVAGAQVAATWCGTWAERDDYNEHGIEHVKCLPCITAHRRRKPT